MQEESIFFVLLALTIQQPLRAPAAAQALMVFGFWTRFQ
jgi:hypothetical protein